MSSANGVDGILSLHPLEVAEILWPDVYIYREQRAIVDSVWNNRETYVAAGNKLGKDYTAGLIVLLFFLTRYPCRIVTTSAKDDHLRVLWGEIGQFIQSSKYPLDRKKGGPLVINHQEIKRVVRGEVCPKSYVLGMVAGPDHRAAMQGHHIANPGDNVPRTLFVSDESSSVPDDYYRMARTWANRTLIFGNTWPCENFFKRGVEGGDVPSPRKDGSYIRKVIKITAEDSPNVRYARAQEQAGINPTGEMLVPGVKGWDDYQEELLIWDDHQKAVSHQAIWYRGGDIMLFPPEWLSRAEQLHFARGQKSLNGAKWIGCDPAEGGDRSTWAIIDEYGLLRLISVKTPDTSVIPSTTIALMREYGVPPENMTFDRGGGGKQHADTLRNMGYNVRTVAFGESLALLPKRGLRMIEEKITHSEERYAYFNRRAQMVGELSLVMNPKTDLDPSGKPNHGFSIPQGNVYKELIRQLAIYQRKYDSEGRLKLPPKNKRGETSKERTIVEMLGCSPDESDAVIIALHTRLHTVRRAVAGALG